MDCLWLTLANLDPPINGQVIYSRGLVQSVAQAGARLTPIGMPSIGASRWRRLVSAVPSVAAHGHSRAMARAIGAAFASRSFDAVVFDSISAGWALRLVQRHRHACAPPPKLVYIAHNHEITVARRIAGAARGVKRAVKALDAIKVRRLERQLIAAADLVTSNTPEDRRTFAAEPGAPPVAYLPPGYDGPRVASRIIDAATPRRAIVVGSFDWPPKRVSLEGFLRAAAPVLAHAGIALQVVGSVEADYLARLRGDFPGVDFVGPVADVRPYMARARIALVPDLLGGFKLKGLDYVFNRLPILAMRVALPGMPLQDGLSVSLFDSHGAMARGIVELIDDLHALNARHERAFAACAPQFDWSRIGRHLLEQMRAAEPRRPAPGPVPIVEGAA